MIIYNISSAAMLSVNSILKIAGIENVKGMKYTATAIHEITMIKEELGKNFLIYSGKDQMAAFGLMCGADGIIGTTYNLLPEFFIEIYNAVMKKDMALAVSKQTVAVQIVMTLAKHKIFGSMIKCMEFEGINGVHCKKPLMDLGEAQSKLLIEDMRKIKARYDVDNICFMKSL